jgi:hypothetical protein
MNLVQEVAALERLSVGQLRQRFAELFGEATLAGNRTWLLKRIAWRLQALAEGDLSERADLFGESGLRRRAHPLGHFRVRTGAPLSADAVRPSQHFIK